MLHECIHAHIYAQGSRGGGPTSHNNDGWIAEVNRIAPLLGFTITAGRSRIKRLPRDDGARGKRGKPLTTPARVTEGTIPFACVAGFPRALRIELGQADAYYKDTALPFAFGATRDV